MKSFQADSLAVRVHPSQAELATDVAQQAARVVGAAIRQQGSATVVFAAANSQVRTLDALVGQGGVDWSHVTMLHMDEYLGIDANHPASFRRFLRERVELKLKPGQFHYLEGDALEPLAECERYTKLLRAQPVDLCLLGIGENGHLAFVDPPMCDFHDPGEVRVVELDEACRRQQVHDGGFDRLEDVPRLGLSLTIPRLLSIPRAVAVVPGPAKRAAIAAAIDGPVTTACPASVLRRHGDARLFLDEASAAGLQGAPS
jgi:glucosamine-6-phosphate deaminase